MSVKAFPKVTVVSLILECALFFKYFRKSQQNSLLSFPPQHKTITSKRQKFDFFDTKFSPEFNELYPTSKRQQKVAKKLLKLK